jgi:putative transposase
MAYPAHIRKRILAELENSTYREVAARHRISPNTLATWKKQPQPKGSRRSTPRLLTEEVIRQDVAEHPDDYQWERAARLGCSQNGICKTLKRYRITVKKRLPPPQGRRRKTP